MHMYRDPNQALTRLRILANSEPTTWIKQNTGLGQVNHSLIIFIKNVIIIYMQMRNT